MTVQAKLVTITKSNNQATPFDVSYTGVTTFRPKVIIAYSGAVNNLTGAAADQQKGSIGFAVETPSLTQRVISWTAEDRSSVTKGARRDDDSYIFRLITSTGGEEITIQLKQFEDTGFTLHYLNNSSEDYQLHFLCLGGTDITDARIDTLITPTSTGLRDYTWSPGFSPDMLFFMSTGAEGGVNTYSTTGSRMAWGAVESNAARNTITTTSRAGLATPDTARRHAGSQALQLEKVVGTTSGQTLQAQLYEKLANGFRLNWTAVDPDRTLPVFYLAIKGGNWKTYMAGTPSATGIQNLNFGYQLRALLAYGVQSTSTSSQNLTHAQMGFGAATSSTDQGSMWQGDRDGLSPSRTARSGYSQRIIHWYKEPAADALSSVIESSAALSGFTTSNAQLDWTDIPTTQQIYLVVGVGDSPPAAGPVDTGDIIGKYDIRQAVSNTAIGIYSMGGQINVGPFTHTYDIYGPVQSTSIGKYAITVFVSNNSVATYHISNAGASVVSSYTIIAKVRNTIISKYEIIEHPSLNLKRYMKPLGLRIFVMSHDQSETFHVFNSFDLEESTIKVLKASVELSIDDAGTFSFTVEDSGHGIDTSVVGEGNAVLIQSAKTAEDLDDGEHNLIMGYITEKEVLRPDTGALEYEFRGAGSMIRFNERLTNFTKSARRIKHDSPEPDITDPDMQAWRLFVELLEESGHLPIGGPLERQFSAEGVKALQSRVNSFIPKVESELTEMSSPMDEIAETGGATWGVSYNPDVNDVFLRYATLEPSSIVLRSGRDIENPEEEDRYNTAWIVGDWSFTDNRDKSQGFSNRFFARVGDKKVTGNVIEVAELVNEFTPLAVDDPPSDEEAGIQLPENEVAGFGPIVNLRSDIVGPHSVVWSTLANYAKEFNFNIFYVVMKIGLGDDGPGPAIGTPVWITPWNILAAAGVRLLGWVDTNKGSKPLAAAKAEIDKWFSTWGPYGIFIENMSTDVSKVSYYKSLSDYAKSKGFKRVVANAPDAAAAPHVGVPDQFFSQCTKIDTFVIWEGARLPTRAEIFNAHYSNYPSSKRAVFVHSVTTKNASDDDVAQWVSNLEHENTADFFYVTDDTKPQPYDKWSGRFRAMMYGAEAAAIRIFQDAGFIVPGVPVQQDLAMSFTAETRNLEDLSLILSKIGNPLPEAGEGKKKELYLEILANRTVKIEETDPETGAVTLRDVEMPHYIPPIAEAKIPFDRINNEYPTVIFLHGLVKRHRDLNLGRRYWVVIYGRGQNESNTIRWHHATEGANEDDDYRVAIRLPATVNRRSPGQRQKWQVFTAEGHPGFALSYFKNTTHMLEASDPDSIDRFGLVESELDLSGLEDEVLAMKTMQAVLYFAAKPKRSYNIGAVTAPDDLILPRMLVRVYDDMTTTGQVTGSTAEGTEAEILSVSYEYDANERPMGCRYVQLDALGHVDFAWAYWYAKYKRGEITPEFPIIPEPPPEEGEGDGEDGDGDGGGGGGGVTPPPPKPKPNAPVVFVWPKGGRYHTATKVKFTTNRKGTKVYYTTNNTNPILTGAGTPAKGNNTRGFAPGISPQIPINSTTTLRFFGVDKKGLRSRMYREKYIIVRPTPPGGGKHSELRFNKGGGSLSLIEQIFRKYVRPALDHVVLKIRLEDILDDAWKNSVLEMPARVKEIEFQSYKHLAQNINLVKAAGFNVVSYNIERDDTPDMETRDVLRYAKRFSSLVKSKGMKVKIAPKADIALSYGSRLAPLADIFDIDVGEVQGNEPGFKRHVRNMRQSIKSNNTRAIVNLKLSAKLKKHQSRPNKSRLNTLKDSWTYAKDQVDGVSVDYDDDTELNTVVEPFMSWFNKEGRSLSR